jgi:hypothetical protein
MNTVSPELLAKIDEVNQWIFPGDQARVMEKCSKSQTYVSLCLNKKKFSLEVLKAAIAVMNENKRSLEIEPSMKVA